MLVWPGTPVVAQWDYTYDAVLGRRGASPCYWHPVCWKTKQATEKAAWVAREGYAILFVT